MAALALTSCGTPGAARSDGGPIRSPAKLYRAFISNSVDLLGWPDKLLVIESISKHDRVYSQPVYRHADLIWSPSEDAVAIIDPVDPTENRITIVTLPSGRRQMEVSAQNVRSLDSRSPTTELYSHVIFSNVKWSDSHQFSATIDAYDPFWPSVPDSRTVRCDFVVPHDQQTGD